MDREPERQRSNIIYNAQWRKVRKFVLERDGYRCQIWRAKCKGVASTADHVIAIVDGGALYDPANCRAACIAGNFGRGGAHRRRPKSLPSREW
jgi:5-methylcytosine-specific restriction endonuclease McrA